MNSRGGERERALYPTSTQKRKLLELLLEHPQLVAFRLTQDFNCIDSQQLWQKVANECNAIPGARKTWRRWRKCWQDIRSKIKKKNEANETLPTYVTRLSVAEQETLGFKNISSTSCHKVKSTSCREATEFIPMNMENTNDSFDNDHDIDNTSLSEPGSPPEEKFSARSQKKDKTITNKDNAKHSNSCIFNCDMLAIQEQKKLQLKEDYYNFRKDYLKQKLLLMKEQTEALKGIAKELAK